MEIREDIDGMIKKYSISLANKYNKFGLKKDAYNEGVLGYFEALQSYNPKKGDLLKWISLKIYNRMNIFFQKEKGYDVANKEYKEEQELSNYNFDITFCDVINDLLKELTDFEQVVYLEYLEGSSFLVISRKVKYPKHKIINIINRIDGVIKERISNARFKTD